jgi:hypothetical protein
MPAERCGAVSIDGTLSCRLPAGHAGYHMTHAGTSFVYDAGRSLEANVAEAAQYASSTRPATKDENETKDETPAREQWRYTGRHCSHEGRPCSFMVWRRLEDDGTPTTGTSYGRDWVMRPAYSIVPSLPWNFS